MLIFISSCPSTFPKTLYTRYDIGILGDNLKKEITTIKLQKSTRSALASIGVKGDSYDDIIRRLLLNYDESITFDSYK